MGAAVQGWGGMGGNHFPASEMGRRLCPPLLRDGVLAFQIAPIPAGEEVTKENAFGSIPPPQLHPHAAAVLGTQPAPEVPPPPPPGQGVPEVGQDARGRPKSEQMCSQGALVGRQERGR